MKSKKKENRSGTATTVSEILSCFNCESGEIGITEIAQKLGVYASKIHRIVSALEESELLEKNPLTKKYRIGLKLFEIGNLYPINLNLRRIIHPHLLELARTLETDARTGILSKFTPYSITVIDWVTHSQSRIPAQRISFNIPIHSSSLGKVFLAFSEREFVRSALHDLELQKFTPSTITDKSRLKEELKCIRNQGYAFDRGETHPEMWCIATPIKDYNDNMVAAISVSSIRQTIEKRQDEIVSKIIKTADFISYQIGSLPF